MLSTMHRRRGGFTLVEIMIVVAIIALLAAIAIPSFLRARKRSQATLSLENLRAVDGAKDQYAIEAGKSPGLTPLSADLVKFVKTGTKLYNDMDTGTGPKDALGNDITINAIDVPPQISSITKGALSDALGTDPDEFWGQYK